MDHLNAPGPIVKYLKLLIFLFLMGAVTSQLIQEPPLANLAEHNILHPNQNGSHSVPLELFYLDPEWPLETIKEGIRLGQGTLLTSKVLVPLVLFSVLCVASYAMMTLTRTARLLRRFPMVPKFPLIGSLVFIIGPPKSLATYIGYGVNVLGRRFVFWLGHKPYVIITEADAAQKVLASPKYIEKGKDYKQFHWLMGNGLITSNGGIWKEDRKLLSPSFKYQRFDGFLESFNKHSKIFVTILNKVFEPAENGTKFVNLHPLLCRCTMDFITEAALGQSSSYQYDINSKFLEAVHISLNSFRTRMLKPYLTLPLVWQIFGLGREEPKCKQFFSEMIREVIKTRKDFLATPEADENTSETRPFIDALLDSKSDEDIAAHIVTIFGAGFETTASGMNYTLFLLAQNPDCQSKVHEELDRVFGQGLDRNRDVTFGDLADLKYLEMCIKEALRLFPPAPVIIRHAIEDIPLDNEENQIIPKGVDAAFLIRELHRDPRTFPDPERFDPDRFLPLACSNRHPYAYIPFSVGPRNCLGMKYAMVQMKTALAHVLRNFKVEAKPLKRDLGVVYGMVLEPSPPIELTLSPI